MSALENPVYQFKGFELDPAEHPLLGDGTPIALTPKVFETLVILVQRAGHVVSKDELMRTLWPRGYVDESNLTKHIWLIRRALGDDMDEAHWTAARDRLREAARGFQRRGRDRRSRRAGAAGTVR